MKPFFLLVFISLVVTISANAQAYEGTARYDKKTQKAIVIEYDYPAEAVQNAIIAKMAKLGYKPREEKGFLNRDKGYLVFKNAYVTEISDKRIDYIVNVEQRSRKNNDESTLYVIMLDDGENAIDKMESESIGRAKVFLNTMIPEIEAANLELQIRDQEDLVTKAEKKLRDLEDDHASLEKKLADNKKDQESTRKDIEAQKSALENLIGKRKL